MDVFDTNVWVLGLTESSPRATGLVESVVEGDRAVSVSAYIYEEVLEVFDNATVYQTFSDRAMENFALIVAKRPNVAAPTQFELREMDLARVRSHASTRLLGTVLSVQPKDSPILWHAHDIDGPTTVFTADRPFAGFEPARHGLTDVELRFVSQNDD